MICGGTIEVLIERLSEEDLPVFQSLIELREQGNDCTLLRVIESDKGIVKRFVVEAVTPESAAHPPLSELFGNLQIPSDKFLQSYQKAQREEGVARISGLTGEIILQAVVGTQPLVIFGGGHIGRLLSKIAAVAGFTVTVIDDREDYARPARFPDAHRTLMKRGREAFSEIEIKKSTSIVIVTRGHESDKEVLYEAIKTPARYIGMIGSGKKVAATFRKLLDAGIPLGDLERVHAPIGIDIGAVTAEEIAASITAEIIRVRRGVVNPSVPLSSRMKSWFDNQRSGLPPSGTRKQ
jgi:xanthine dehydrogenase accessory factor